MKIEIEKKSIMDSIEDFLQSSAGMFIALVMVLAFSTPNTTEVLYNINRLKYLSNDQVRVLALSFAIVIEFIILILAAIGQDKAAEKYAWASFAFHLLYYHRWDELILKENYQDPVIASKVITNFIASILTSGMISASIRYFSEQLAKKIRERRMIKEASSIELRLSELKKVKSEHDHSVSEAIKHASKLAKELSEINSQLSKSRQEITDAENSKAKITEEVTSLRKALAGMSKGEKFKELQTLNEQSAAEA